MKEARPPYLAPGLSACARGQMRMCMYIGAHAYVHVHGHVACMHVACMHVACMHVQHMMCAHAHGHGHGGHGHGHGHAMPIASLCAVLNLATFVCVVSSRGPAHHVLHNAYMPHHVHVHVHAHIRAWSDHEGQHTSSSDRITSPTSSSSDSTAEYLP